MKTEIVKIAEFKALKNVNAEINGNHILLIGENGLGKSSFMQFIQIALGKQSNIPENATGSGEVIVSKNGQQFTFQVKFKNGKPQVTVISPDGIKDNRKGTIASIVGAIEFDINEFVELSKSSSGQKKQVEFFKSLLDKEVIEALNRYELKAQNSYDDRTILNRDLKQISAKIETHSLYNEIMYLDKFQCIDITSIYAKIQEANKHNETIIKGESTLAQRKESAIQYSEQIIELEKKIEELKKQQAENIDNMVKIEEWLKINKRIDVSGLEKEISQANEINNKANLAKELKSDLEKQKMLKESVGELTALIESSKQAISDTIKQMDSPVKGLEYIDDKLYYNGIPVSPDNLSTSEIIELGIKMKIAENPELGILFIEHGESIGAERLKLIKEIADKNDFQIIMEQVQRGQMELIIQKMED